VEVEWDSAPSHLPCQLLVEVLLLLLQGVDDPLASTAALPLLLLFKAC